jgi:hypothetical protein
MLVLAVLNPHAKCTLSVLNSQAAFAGFNCVCCCLGYAVRGKVSLRVQQLDVLCDTKTKDNVFVQLQVPLLPRPYFTCGDQLAVPSSMCHACCAWSAGLPAWWDVWTDCCIRRAAGAEALSLQQNAWALGWRRWLWLQHSLSPCTGVGAVPGRQGGRVRRLLQADRLEDADHQLRWGALLTRCMAKTEACMPACSSTS